MGHPKFTNKTGIGCHRDPSKPRARIKQVSKKQRIRTDKLRENFERVLKAQYDLYGRNFCQAGAWEWANRCPNNRGKHYPLFPDHVGTRNQTNPDRHENIQPLCGYCNFLKGSRRMDFRPPDFREACKKLDEK